MQATKKIHLSPNGNIIKINGNIYRHYTRNLTVSLPSIFYAMMHGATVYEVMSNGETIELTPQNYALDNEKMLEEQREQKYLKSLSEKDNESKSDEDNVSDSIKLNTLTTENETNYENSENKTSSVKKSSRRK